MSLVIVGSIGLDSIETPAGKVDEVLGGSAIYGALAASHFTQAKVVGVVGDDFPEEGFALLKGHNVDLEGLEVIPGKTFRWKGKYTNFNQAETLSTELNVFAGFSPKLPASYRKCRSLLLGNIHPDLQMQVLDAVEDFDIVACDTMNYWINLCPERLTEVVRRVDIVLINEDEIRQYTGEKSIFKAAVKMLGLGPKAILIKRGEYGSVMVTEDNYYFVPAYPVETVKDTTGAGDSFAGGFIGYLSTLEKIDDSGLRKAIRYGTILAAMNVSEFSVDGLTKVGRAEIEQMLTKLEGWI